MNRQHGLIAIFFLVVLSALAAGLAWQGRTLRERLKLALSEVALLTEKLHAETNARANAQRDLQSLQKALFGQEAALRDFVGQVHIVHTVTLDLIIEGGSEDGGEALAEKVPVIAVDLVAPDGRALRFTNDFDAPPTVEHLDSGAIRMTFRCEPVRPPDIYGRPIADLETFTRLRAAYGGVLAAVGVVVTPDATKHLVLRVNDVQVVNAAVAPSSPDSWEYDLAHVFAGLYGRYQNDLQNRISAASTETSPAP